jgi:hypothetical protein
MMLGSTKFMPERHIIGFQYHTIDIEVEVFFSVFGFFIENNTEIIDSRNIFEGEIFAFESPGS